MIKAQIRDGAVVGCDFRQIRWKNNGEVFEVSDFRKGRKQLVRDGYGSLEEAGKYGAGSLFVNEEDLIYQSDRPWRMESDQVTELCKDF